MTNRKQIGKNGIGKNAVGLTVSKIISLLISLVTARLLSDYRSLQEYGTYSQLLLVISLATAVFMMGLPNSINYFLSRAESGEEKRAFLSVYFTLSTFLGVVMGISLGLLTPVIVAYFNNPTINGFIYFLVIYPWANVIFSCVENILIVYNKTKFLLLYKLTYSICVLLIVVLMQLLKFGFKEYIVAYLIISVIFAISVYVISFWLSGGIKVCFNKKWIKDILIFSVPLGVASVIGTLDIEIDKLFVGYVMDTEQLAIYTNASKELPLTIIATSVTAVLMPRVTILLKNKRNIEAIELWKYATEISMIFMGLMVAGIVAFAPDVMSILYTEKYLPGLQIFRIYTLFLLVRVTYFGLVLNSNGETKKILLCSVLALLFNAVLNPVLFYTIGIEGPAIATLASVIIVSITQLIMTSRTTGVAFGKVFPWERSALALGLNAVMAVFFTLVKNTIPLEKYLSSIGESIALGIVWGGIYFLVLKKRLLYLWNKLNSTGEE